MMKALRQVAFLLDTNILIPLEPTRNHDFHANSETASRLVGMIHESQHLLLIHPESIKELEGDRDEERRSMRVVLLQKYPLLKEPPILKQSLNKLLGNPQPGTHDEIDNCLIASVIDNAVDYLITEDQGIHKKTAKLNLSEKVLTIDEALALLISLLPRIPEVPPTVVSCGSRQLNFSDPIFATLAEDYPNFDKWQRKCKRDDRPVWIVHDSDGSYSAVAITKHEDETQHGQLGNILKLCTFKVALHASGKGYGDLLLNAVLSYARANNVISVYVTVLQRHRGLIKFLYDYGFYTLDSSTILNEKVMQKDLVYTDKQYSVLEPLMFNKLFGPDKIKLENVAFYVIPIQPHYHRLLFPWAEDQLNLFPGSFPAGNTMKKAYICHSQTSELPPGSVILFYRSSDLKEIRCVGVVEKTMRLDDSMDVLKFVGQRSVYSPDELDILCRKEVLVILFRYCMQLENPIELKWMLENELLRAAPMSITKLRKEIKRCLKNRIRQ